MRRILAIAALVIGASFLMAAGPEASSSSNPLANPPEGAQPEGPPPPASPQLQNATPGSDGALFKSLGWEKIREKTGISFYYYLETGISTNNTIQKGVNGADPGDANEPVATPSDADEPSFENLEQFIERSIKGNMVVGATPTPAPMSKKFDWGFQTETEYGREANGCRMPGYDYNWSLNPNPKYDYENRYMYLCEPNSFLDLYVPILKGIAFRFGRQADNLMIDEIPPQAFFSPDMFYSHTYGFYRVVQVLGGRVTANSITGMLFVTAPRRWIPGLTTPAALDPPTSRSTPVALSVVLHTMYARHESIRSG